MLGKHDGEKKVEKLFDATLHTIKVFFLILRLLLSIYSQSEIYWGIFDNYGGTSGKIFDNYRGHYVGEVQILNV